MDSFAFVQEESLQEILNSTLGFERIFVLNLPHRTDRRDAISLAAASSDIALEYVDGVTGDSIHEAALPLAESNLKMHPGIRGSWRTHMNALRRIVEQNLTTALILEDDVDWDVRIRQNLQRFALASRFLSSTTDALSVTSQYAVQTRPNVETEESSIDILDNKKLAELLRFVPLSDVHGNTLRHNPHKLSSPYGDPSNWDVLWIGHCGVGLPRTTLTSSRAGRHVDTSNVLLTLDSDDTVPAPRHLKAHPFQAGLDPLATAFPPHTRLYHRSTGGQLCTAAYAVSQRGARRLLHQFAVKGWSDIFDKEMGRWCASEDSDLGAGNHRRKPPQAHSAAIKSPVDPASLHFASSTSFLHGKVQKEARGLDRVCLTSQPPIFGHHHPSDGQSDIGGLGGGFARKLMTKYLRLSVRMNLERIVEGLPLVDQWPDEGEQVLP